MKKLFIGLSIVSSLLIFSTGCAQNAIPANRAGVISQSYPGVVTMIENTRIQGDGQIAGVIGAIAGGAAGSKVGGGSGQDMASMAGAVLGSMIGSKADIRPAKRVTVKLDDGRVITTVLPVNKLNPMNFSVGSRVTVYITNGVVTEIR